MNFPTITNDSYMLTPNEDFSERYYGIKANKGGGSVVENTSKGRNFPTYNCQYCQGDVEIIQQALNNVKSSWLQDTQGATAKWITRDDITGCLQCRSCYDHCNGGCQNGCYRCNNRY